MKSLLPLVSLSLALAGCYEAPGSAERGQILSLERSSSEALLADGHDIVDFVVKVDPLTPAASMVTIQTSSGTLAPETNPTAENARKIDRKNPGDGSIPFSLRVGQTPGETIVSARLGDFEDSLTLDLGPSEATQLQIDAESTQVTADGAAKLTVNVLLYAADAEKSVSIGERVELIGCCLGPNDTPTACDTSTLVSFPKLVALEQGQVIPVQIAPRKLTGADPVRLWLVAQSQKEGRAALSCDAAAETPVLKRLLLTLNPAS